MPKVKYFLVKCKTTSTNTTFGLCDDPPPANDPAYIDEQNPANWIATVNNNNNREVKFFAIDNCTCILKPDGREESRCDGMLLCNGEFIFVELKDRGSSGWLSKGGQQIITTIKRFVTENNCGTSNIKAYVCNKQRPLTITGSNVIADRVKTETGVTLRISREINIA